MKTLNCFTKTHFLITLIIGLFISTNGFYAQNSISFNSNKGKSTIKISNDRTDFKVEYEGEITIADDDSDITNVSRGGYIEIKKSSFGKRRRLVIENDGGKLIRKFFVGWSEKDYYPDGKEWLKDVLPEILRSTTIGAESRVERFYKKDGVNGVLGEIRKMDSDYVQSAYFKLLLKKNLSNKELVGVLNAAGRTISSDHYLSSILKKNQEIFLKDTETVNAYISAAKSINSDHYVTQIVKSVIENRNVSDTQMATLLKITEGINSDHYVTSVLKTVMDKRDLNTQNMEQIMMLSKSINSDHYKTSVLKKALKSKNLSKQAYDTFLSSLSDVNSDHYITEILKDMMSINFDDATLKRVVGLVESNIGSDHYASSVYKRMAKRKLNDDQIVYILNSIDNVGSDNYMADVLVAFAPKVKNGSNKVKDAYMKAAKSINSETYLGRAMKAIY